ncbi:hypothetical protein [Microbulbifer epialgicus]|uniref:PH domain-containing protein n=1 Tax=Microbulbifer epialgicus TaxID=393907 RepID=A0ABV4P457_9GAMM
MAIITMIVAIKKAFKRQEDPDVAIEESVQKYAGRGVLSKIITFETRVWMFAFWAKSICFHRYRGDRYFSYHLKDGAQSTALGFICLILLELPIVHTVVHFIWSPMAANIVSLLSVLGLLFLVADYRSMSRRPISITSEEVIIRFGIFNSKKISLGDILYVDESHGYIKRQENVKRYNYSANPNVVIGLKQDGLSFQRVYVGLDQPKRFIDYIRDMRVR